jgi:cytidylate kinase
MTSNRSIAISGDLGSGKTAIASRLAERMQLQMLNVGNLYRQMAQQRGMSALQLNIHAERDEAVDEEVDRRQGEIARSGEQMIIDSRLGWHFFRDAFKVHLVADSIVAGSRVMSRPASEAETYSSLEQAVKDLKRRNESERVRFLRKYGVDKARLRNYDLICDTTRATLDSTADYIASAFDGSYCTEILGKLPPLLLLDPARIYPSENVKCLRGLWDGAADFAASVQGAGLSAIEPISVGYTGDYFYVVDGHRRLSAALQADLKLISASLTAEGEEEVAGGLPASRYLEASLSLGTYHDWQDIHGIELPAPPVLLAQIDGAIGC